MINKNEKDFLYYKPEADEYNVTEDDIERWEREGCVLNLMVCADCGRISETTCPYHLSDNWMFKARVYTNNDE